MDWLTVTANSDILDDGLSCLGNDVRVTLDLACRSLLFVGLYPVAWLPMIREKLAVVRCILECLMITYVLPLPVCAVAPPPSKERRFPPEFRRVSLPLGQLQFSLFAVSLFRCGHLCKAFGMFFRWFGLTAALCIRDAFGFISLQVVGSFGDRFFF